MPRRAKRGRPTKEEEEDAEESWHLLASSRMREVGVGCFCALFSIFLLLVLVDSAGSVGTLIREHAFARAGGMPGLLGWNFITLLVLFLSIGLYLIFIKRPMRPGRLWLGGILAFLSIAAFFSSISEVGGGTLGMRLFGPLEEFFGLFANILIPVGIFASLCLLRVISPVGIWKWLNEHDVDFWRGDSEEAEDAPEEPEEAIPEEDEDFSGEDFADEEDPPEEDAVDEEEDEFPEEDPEDISAEAYDTEDPALPEAEDAEQFEDYVTPPLSLLNSEKGKGKATNTKLQAQTIERTLRNFSLSVEVEEVTVGPTFTRYSVRPAEGVRLSKITGLQQNLELALAAHPIRIEAPIPGQSLVGIEVPNSTSAVVGLRTLLNSREFKQVPGALPLAIGKTITGSVFAKSLSAMPHTLIAGTTGSGKSVLIHNFILSLLFTHGPRDLRFIFIDPKRVELTLYRGIAHLYTPPITEPKKALQALMWTVSEMERRYEILEAAGARDIASHNRSVIGRAEHLPYLVIVIDELADLMQSFPREIEAHIVRIAQKSRAVGIHLIVSTQRPSVNIITGVVKANIPVRIALQVASSIDSRTILDATGAENLVGNGDLLYSSAENKKPVRVQSAFISEEEVKEVARHILEYNGVAESLIDLSQKTVPAGTSLDDADDEDVDTLYDEARDIVLRARRASTSLLQRKLKIGYSRAARLIDALEERGVVGPQIGSKPREILEQGSSDEEDSFSGA